MGEVIDVDSTNPDHAVVTTTGSGGLLSTGYLADEPAAAALGDDEYVAAVLTNLADGVVVEREGTSEDVTPGADYRTISLVTSRRVLAFVGGADPDGGDRRLETALANLETASADDGLVVTDADGRTLRVPCDADDGDRDDALDRVVEFLTTVAAGRRQIATHERALTAALRAAQYRRDRGDVRPAAARASEAVDHVGSAADVASRVADATGAEDLLAHAKASTDPHVPALAACLESCVETLLEAARRYDAEDAFAAAHDRYERAQAAMADIGALAAHPAVTVDRDRQEAVEESLDELRRRPLESAIAADETAGDAEEVTDAATAFGDAVAWYDRTLALVEGDAGAFVGDAAKIRDRRDVVLDHAIDRRRQAAADAREAAEWYREAGQRSFAVEEFERRRDHLEAALALARAHDHPTADDLADRREVAVEELATAVTAGADAAGDDAGDDERPADAADSVAADTADSVAADTADSVAADAADSVAIDDRGPSASASERGPAEQVAGDGGIVDLTERLRELSPTEFTDVVGSVLVASGWTVEAATPTGEYDLVVTSEQPGAERMVVVTDQSGEIGPARVDDAASVLGGADGSVDADGVMLATAGTVAQDGARRARRRGVRLLDAGCIAAVVEDVPESTASNDERGRERNRADPSR